MADENVIMLDDVQDSGPLEELSYIPEGWGEGDDPFADPRTWKGAADAQADTEDDAGAEAEAEGEAPTTELETEAEANEQGDEDEGLPTKQSASKQPDKVKFQGVFDHKLEDVELEYSQLPDVWQKSKALERVQKRMGRLERLAKHLEYDSAEDFYKGTVERLVAQEKDRLVGEGVNEAIAEDYARRNLSALLEDMPEEPSAAKRDYGAEVEELVRAHPEFGDPRNPIPDEVTRAATAPGGKSLLDCYNDYVAQKTKAENDALRKENKLLKQREKAASRAPVKGVSKGGATDTTPEDPFLKGFLSSNPW